MKTGGIKEEFEKEKNKERKEFWTKIDANDSRHKRELISC